MIPRHSPGTAPTGRRPLPDQTPPPPQAPTTDPRRGPPAPSGELERLSLRPRPPGGVGGTQPPRAALPAAAASASSASSSAGGGASPSPADVLSAARTAKRKMAALLERYEAAQQAVTQAATAQEQLDRLQQLMDAGHEILALYASLPRSAAVRVFTDEEVRTLRDDLMRANEQSTVMGNTAYLAMKDRQAKDADLLARMVKLNESRDPPLDLSQLEARVRKHAINEFDWWTHKAARAERALAVCRFAAGLPSTSAADRALEDAQLRELSGKLVFESFVVLHSRTQLALAAMPHMGEPSPAEASGEDSSLASILMSFRDDILPAFQSTGEDVMRGQGRPLEAASCAVLEGVVGRLAEFATTLEQRLAGLREEQATAGLPVEAMEAFIEDAWITANKVTDLLTRQPSVAGVAGPSGSAAAAPAETAAGTETETAAGSDHAPATDTAAEGPAGARRKKKRRPGPGSAPPAAAAGTMPAAAAAAQLQAPAAAAPAKVLTRTALGTQVLTDAVPPGGAALQDDASAGAAAAAGAVAAVKPPPAETLAQRLSRLETLVGFDLPAQQREVSRARRELAPESARHVAEEAVRRLAAQATAMAACLAEWEDQGLRRTLSAAQQDQVHTQTRRLRVLLADVQGQAKALQDGMDRSTLDHMKTYAFPTQAHVAELQQAGELAAAGPARALKGEPGTLFELKLQPAALRNGVLPRPIWLHVHTAWPVKADQLSTLDDAAFAASHVKSDAGRGHNRQWQQAQAAAGRDNVLIHRGKISPALCRTLMAPQ